MKEEKYQWSWENRRARKAFADWVGFPESRASEREVRDIERLVRVRVPCDVLDVGCGNGRHALALARRGYRVTGTDIADEWLAEARRAAVDEGLDVTFKKVDGRNLTERGVYDLVLAYNFTLGFMNTRQLRQWVRRVRRALKTNGRLLLKTAGPQIIPGMECGPERSWGEKEGTYILTETEFKGRFRHEECIEIDTNNNRVTKFSEKQRAFSLDEVMQLLREEGFSSVRAYRDLAGRRATKKAFGVFLCRP